MELRATSSGGVGLYPEHAANLAWLEREVAAFLAANGRASVLNLFAHTGLATLAAARAGASVAHVDAARASVAWARRNASLNDLDDREIRWLVDDAQAFVEREGRRGRRYDGIVLDPPSSGHGRSGRGRGGRWTLQLDLPGLLAASARLLVDDGFVLLTAHSTGLEGSDLARQLGEALPARRSPAAVVRLGVTAESGAELRLGWAIRLGRETSRLGGEPSRPAGEPSRPAGEPILRNAAP